MPETPRLARFDDPVPTLRPLIVPDHWKQLRIEWQQLLVPFRPPPREAASAFADLVNAYAAVGRFYHTLEHLQHVLNVVARLGALARDLPAVRLAAWFHDAVYDSRAKDNEERSAALAATVLTALGVPPATVAHVRDLILLTQTHVASPEESDGHVLLDADLAILGSEERAYARYAHAIRQEYAWVPEVDYRTGRAQVLEQFLRRDCIYRRAPMFEACEVRARRNLRAERETLA